jgi:hypothetical protein
MGLTSSSCQVNFQRRLARRFEIENQADWRVSGWMVERRERAATMRLERIRSDRAGSGCGYKEAG